MDQSVQTSPACAEASPWSEAQRIRALHRYNILDTPTEPLFDDIAQIAAEVCEAPIAVVNFVGNDRQWFKAEVGIGQRELPLDVSICRHAILQPGLFVVPDLSLDDRFEGNPLVHAGGGLRFYAGALLETPDGLPIGTVCVLDTVSRPDGLAQSQARVLATLARQVMSELELRRALADRDAEIARARETEQRLRGSETRLHLAQRAAAAVAWEWDLPNQLIRWADPDFIEELVGEDLGETTTFEEWMRHVHPDDIERHLSEGAAAVAAGHGRVTFRIVRGDEVRWLEATGQVTSRDSAGQPLTLTGITQDITRRMLREEALRTSETRLRLAIEAGQVGEWELDLTSDTAVRAFRHDQIFGYDEPLPEWGFEKFISHVLPEDRPHVERAFRTAAETGSGWHFECRIRRANDGRVRWIGAHSEPQIGPDGKVHRIFGIVSDITEQREPHERLRRLLDQLFAFVGIMTTDGVLIEANRAPLKAAGIEAEDVLGRPFWEAYWWAYDPAVQARLREAVAEAAAGKLVRYDVPVRMAGGVLVTIDFQISPLRDSEGIITHFIPSGVVVEERVQAEAELRRLNAELEQRVARAVEERQQAQEALRQSQKLEAMGQLTGGVAHDFNNLLSPIIGGLDLLQRRGLGDERTQRTIGGALASAERAKTLVQRLLAFARRQPLQPTAVDLSALVSGMAELVASTSGPRVKVRVELPSEIPPVKADPNQLEMAILNLAVNARDAMPDGGSLTISAVEEELARGSGLKLKPGRYVRLCVADTGVGMDEAVLARAIEPFFSTKGIGKGTGLGLSMVHGLAAQLGGGLEIQSKPGVGTNIELYLPVADAVPPDRAAAAEAEVATQTGTALLVDDEELVRASTADMLSDMGYRVIEAVSAEQALKRLADEPGIHLVVTDHLMPGMTGTDLAREVQERRPGLPVLVISGYADVDGIAPHLPRLTKPFRQADLAAALAAMLAQPQA